MLIYTVIAYMCTSCGVELLSSGIAEKIFSGTESKDNDFIVHQVGMKYPLLLYVPNAIIVH